MRFYVNVSYDIRKNLFHIREYDNGKRIVRSERCRPYAFVTNSNQTYKSDYKTLDGKSVAKVSLDRKSTRLNSSHIPLSRMPSSA